VSSCFAGQKVGASKQPKQKPKKKPFLSDTTTEEVKRMPLAPDLSLFFTNDEVQKNDECGASLPFRKGKNRKRIGKSRKEAHATAHFLENARGRAVQTGTVFMRKCAHQQLEK